MHRILLFAAAVAACLAGGTGARAETPLDGNFVAARACPALQSVRKATNPGAIQTEPGRSYPIFAQNKPNGDRYWIGVSGAAPERRWVEAGCGARSGGTIAASARGPATAAGRGTKGGGKTDYVFAISWQPAFCETRPKKPECASQTADRFDASHFTLHGLWPQPRTKGYCGVDPALVATDKGRNWQQLPQPPLSAATRATLARVMPGVQSGLDRHEWLRHGTCYGADADTYFSDGARLLESVNASPVRALFAANVGKSLDTSAIRAAVEAAFGAGAGERLRVACRKDGEREIITELTLGLGGRIGPDSTLSGLLAASRPTKPGCPSGVVDAVGRQ